jgi:hypothetical protein
LDDVTGRGAGNTGVEGEVGMREDAGELTGADEDGL